MSLLWDTEAGNRADRREVPLNEDFAAPGKARVDADLLRSLMKKSDMAGGLQLASHLVAIACSGTGLWLTWGSWWGVPFFAAHGMLINWLYAAQHEASHDTVFRRRWMNEWLGRMTGFILIYPRDHDRWQHLCHHRHTQDPNGIRNSSSTTPVASPACSVSAGFRSGEASLPISSSMP